ncbi:MAG: peptidase [Arcobacter sp.]|nr:MAG: peptidase [Arcobacter sp.]
MFKYIFIFLILIQSLFAENTIIGKYDRIDLPILKLENLRAKIDTGAKTSSLHCSYIKDLDKKTVVFEVLDETHEKYKKIRYSMPIKRVAKVRSSNGITENRYVISTKVIIFEKNYDVEFTLRDRKKMNYPILLGREFLEKGFLVDVSKENISYYEKNSK